ncbi:hypothetical protein OMAG_002468 [Candidatus Omnitrophus magneticus]|uniref:Uncharacterized protein n=1 Tax=Candidatus Omnitrophus magneticus TaxID=1609969 RepID=A0A0F0CNR7_9BACT|nr:hypothetical protein OMAG_002468 [Candidatus Omnitrophus magneticus]
MTSDEYMALRARLRRNSFINSQQVLEKLFAFKAEQILMGGIVTRQSQSMRGCRQEVLDITPDIGSSWEYPDPELAARLFNIELEIYDFSGKFVVQFFRNKQGQDMRQRLLDVKEGDVLYVLGDVIPVNCEEQYNIMADRLFTEDEFEMCRRGYRREIRNVRRIIRRIKQRPAPPKGIDNIICYHSMWDPMAIVRLFIAGGRMFASEDYFWLAESIYTMYERQPSPGLTRLLRKYYCVYKRCTPEDISTDADINRDFYSNYPALAAI